jgi:hypothetical protein
MTFTRLSAGRVPRGQNIARLSEPNNSLKYRNHEHELLSCSKRLSNQTREFPAPCLVFAAKSRRHSDICWQKIDQITSFNLHAANACYPSIAGSTGQIV